MSRNSLTILLIEVIAVWGSLLSWQIVNLFLQFIILLFGAASAAIGFYRLWKSERMTKEKTDEEKKKNPGS